MLPAREKRQAEKRFLALPSRKPHWVAILAAIILTLGHVSLLLGLHTDILPNNEFIPHTISLHSHTIIAMTAAIAALWLRIHPAPFLAQKANRAIHAAGQVLATLIILFGLASLANIVFEWQANIAPLFLTRYLGQYALQENAMSFLGAWCFILAGASLLLLDRKTSQKRYPAEYCALIVAAIMCIPMIGFLFDVQVLALIAPAAAISRQAPPAFLLLAVGILFARPWHPMIAVMFSQAPGGRLLRTVLPATLILLVALDMLTNWGARQGYYSADMTSPLALLLGGALLLVLFWRAALMLNHEYGTRLKGEAELARTNDLIRIVCDSTTDAIHVKDHKGRVIFANPAALQMFDKDLRSTLGRTYRELLSDQVVAAKIHAHIRSVFVERRAQSMEFSLQTPTGLRTRHLTSAPWVGPHGEALGTVGIATDITERKRSEDALKAHEAQLERLVEERTREVRELIGHLECLREEEKRTIARELHDDLGSSLTALSMHLTILFQQFPSDTAITERAVQIRALLDSITATTRRIQNGLRPDKLDIFGIKTAITDLAADFENYTGVGCVTSLPDEDIAYSSQVEITLFRVVQEALNNIAKHARASRVDIVLDDDGDYVFLNIRDNGIGIAAQTPPSRSTHGLRGMRERAAYLGGSIDIDSVANGGTRIRVCLPKAFTDAPGASFSMPPLPPEPPAPLRRSV